MKETNLLICKEDKVSGSSSMQQQPSWRVCGGGEGGHSVPHCRTQFDVKCDPTILVATATAAQQQSVVLGLGSDLIPNSLCALSAPCWVPGTLDTLAWSHGHTAAGSVAAVPACICAALQDVPIHTLTAGRHCRLLQAGGCVSSRLQIENNFLRPPPAPPPLLLLLL